jgi:hypothetical protein
MLANTIFRKLGRQAERQKTNPVYRAGAEAEAERRKEANDGEWVRSDDPGATNVVSSGGIDQTNLAFLLQVKDMYFTLGGNLDALGGLSPQAETLGQDQLLLGSATNRLVDMQDRTTEGVTNVIRALMWYEWTDPLRSRKLKFRVPGTSIDMELNWTPEQREGDMIQYEMVVQPYSMVSSSPGSKLQAISQVFDRFIAPYQPQMQEQGVGVNFENLMRTISKYGNLPELEDMLDFGQPPPVDVAGGGSASSPRQAPVTTRNNVRTNIPGANRQGADTALAAILAGGRMNQDQTRSIGRQKG